MVELACVFVLAVLSVVLGLVPVRWVTLVVLTAGWVSPEEGV